MHNLLINANNNNNSNDNSSNTNSSNHLRVNRGGFSSRESGLYIPTAKYETCNVIPDTNARFK